MLPSASSLWADTIALEETEEFESKVFEISVPLFPGLATTCAYPSRYCLSSEKQNLELFQVVSSGSRPQASIGV